MPRFWNNLIHLKNTLTISIYRIIVYVQIEAYLSATVKLFVPVAFVMGDISTWSMSHWCLVHRFCRKSFTVSTWLTFPRLANYYIRYLQINQHLLDLNWQRNVWLCGFCMWRWHESKHHIGDLNCSVVKHVPNRKIGTCWVIWMI